MKHIVFFSGGACSYNTAKRVVEKHGAANVILMFSDTGSEEASLYQSLQDSSKSLGAELVILKDGRDIWDLAEEQNFVYNSRVANCTKILKIGTARKYIKENYDPNDCVLYMGIDWTESHRIAAPIKHWSPYKVEFPMNEEPYLDKFQMIEVMKEDNVTVPELYAEGFAHSNCGGFCFKAGIGHFVHLRKTRPDVYDYHAKRERELSARLLEETGSERTILKRMIKGENIPISLDDLAVLVDKESEGVSKLHASYTKKVNKLIDIPISVQEKYDVGGCGCFSVEDDY